MADTDLELFPTLEALLEDFHAMIPALEPRYTNVRPGDLMVTGGDAALTALHAAALEPANDFTRRNQLAALAVLGFTPRAATAASVKLTFTLAAGALPFDVTIPAGSEWGTADRKVTFTVDASATITAGQTSVADVLATCTAPGASGNAGAGTVTQNLSAVAYVAATNAERATGGEDAETDDEFLARAAEEYAQHQTLVKETDFAAAAEAVPGVYRAACLPITRANGDGTFDTLAGHVSVLAIPDDGGTLTALLQQTIYDTLAALTFAEIVANGGLHVTDFGRVSVDVAYGVRLTTGADEATTLTACNDALSVALDPRTWTAGRAVSAFELGAILEAVAGVDYVVSLTVNGGTSVAVDDTHVTTPGTFTGASA